MTGKKSGKQRNRKDDGEGSASHRRTRTLAEELNEMVEEMKKEIEYSDSFVKEWQKGFKPGDYFCLPYWENDSQVQETYPDYIIFGEILEDIANYPNVKFANLYSTHEPEGEGTLMHVCLMVPISKEDFELARKFHWENDTCFPILANSLDKVLKK